ncbi:MAG: hypothetical protein WC804_09480 [Sphingomonas sp.]|jgi:hypothetical protein|uniref:hypothetical protein n=1 Tax=Sphingomonas sp. TaxID=28214 RepID=UPI003567FE1F
MSASAPRSPCPNVLRPDLSAYFVIRRARPATPARIEPPVRGILAELARYGRP